MAPRRMQHIPTIDLANIDPKDILTGLGHFGLVYVKNHGIDPALLDAFYNSYQRFCAQPDSEKAKLGGPKVWFQRGWTPPNTEQAVAASGQPDFKECYFMSPTTFRREDALRYPQICCDNVWPEDPEFKERYTQISNALQAAGETLLKGTALALDLREDTFSTRLKDGAHVTRALRYLPLKPEQVNTGILWGEEHTDFNLLTLLPGGRFIDPQGKRSPKPDNGSGLYLKTRSGERVPGAAPEGCIVAQVGQQLEILTGGKLLATPHVVTPPQTPGFSRLSMAHFIHVHPDELLKPLGQYATDDALLRYRPSVNAGVYSLKTLVDIGLAPKSELDTLGYRAQ